MYSSPAPSGPPTPQNMTYDSMPSAPQQQQQQHEGRLMQVKVLYTFDDNNRTNCLARCPQPLHIRTAYLDPSTEIGIIELRTCIQAIVAASPELVARLGQDYTVYAFDYSEYETPLVGQGMLSWVLASASSTPTAPADESLTMVTGRVCKNLLGLFSNGIKETLEVKLRLVPVPTSLQNEYQASMEKSRDTRHPSMEGFDAAAWSSFLRTNSVFQQQKSSMMPSPTLDHEASFQTWDNASISGHTQQHPSRPTTPLDTTAITSQSRPSSRASIHGRPSTSHSNMSTRHSLPQADYNTDAEEGPARKRARTMKADWRGPSAFGNTSESLRVTASTAASIRSHRPSLSGLHSSTEFAVGDSGFRPPTPRPHSAMARRSVLSRSSTSLAREHNINSSDGYISPYLNEGQDGFLTSPEKSDAGSTPQDVPSSPPVLHGPSPGPSSPSLPQLPNFADSGFVSGAIDECMTENDDDLRSPAEMDQSRTQFQPLKHSFHRETPPPGQLKVTEEMPGDPRLLPTKILPRPISARRGSKAVNVSSPCLGPAPFSSEAPASDMPLPLPVAPPTFARAPSSMSANLPSEVDRRSPDLEGSVGPADERSGGGKQFTGSSLKRKAAIQDRLMQSIQAGKAPPFCRNCGEINTPTWRKTFMKIVNGDPEDRTPEQMKKIIATELLQYNDEGKAVQYRHFKKAITSKDTEEGFEEVQLCNPCGIWLTKWGQMRPPEKWYKSNQPIKTRVSRKKKGTDGGEAFGSEPPSEAIASTEIPDTIAQPLQQQVSQEPQPRRALQRTSSTTSQNQQLNQESQSRRSLQRTSSTVSQMDGTQDRPQAEQALQRAIQSSPPRIAGSRHSPIELEEDRSENVTRRLIFPSPRKPGEVKLLDAPSITVDLVKQTSPVQSPDVSKLTDGIDDLHDKENIAPVANHEDDSLAHLFESTSEGLISPLRLPRTPKSAVRNNVLKTPSSSTRRRLALTPRAFMALAQAAGHPSTPSPSRSAATLLTLTADAEMTPFTRHLTQLLNDANPEGGLQQDGDFGLGMDFDFGDTSMMDGNMDAGALFTFSDFSNDAGMDDLIHHGSQHGSVNGSVTGSFDFTMYEDPVETEATGDFGKDAATVEKNGVAKLGSKTSGSVGEENVTVMKIEEA